MCQHELSGLQDGHMDSMGCNNFDSSAFRQSPTWLGVYKESQSGAAFGRQSIDISTTAGLSRERLQKSEQTWQC